MTNPTQTTHLINKPIDLMRHALGLPNDRNKSFRNRFLAADHSTDYGHWAELERKGFARGDKNPELWGNRSTMFYLTREAALKVLNKGEKLDEEDFPNGK